LTGIDRVFASQLHLLTSEAYAVFVSEKWMLSQEAERMLVLLPGRTNSSCPSPQNYASILAMIGKGGNVRRGRKDKLLLLSYLRYLLQPCRSFNPIYIKSYLLSSIFVHFCLFCLLCLFSWYMV
jgi:hypothetical protein